MLAVKGPSAISATYMMVAVTDVDGNRGILGSMGEVLRVNIGALIIRIGFWGTLYYIHNKDPPQEY